MLHTINWSISNVNAINIKKFPCFKKYNEYSYYYVYKKGIKFTYYALSSIVTITTTTFSVLERTDITVNECKEYMKRLKKIVGNVINASATERLLLTRFDIFCDIRLQDTELKILEEQIFKKLDFKYRWMTSKEQYETSIHLSNKKRTVQH